MPIAGGRRMLAVVVAGALSLVGGVQAWAQDHPAATSAQFPTLRISGFGDVNFARSTNDADPTGFLLGQLALHMISELSPRVTFFGEISFTPRSDAGTGAPAATGFNTEIERMFLRFDHSDRFKVSFGRYHTPINYWNTAFHHGQWLQTAIARPEMIRFGSQLLPVHFVGALVEGTVPVGGWHLGYTTGLGNGRSVVISRAGDAGDADDSLAWLGNLSVRPDRVYDLEFGTSVYVDRITRTDRTVDEQIVAAHVVWHKETPEVLAETAAVRHRDPVTSLATWSQASYAQIAWRLAAWGAAWKPYYRFEHVGVDAADLVLSAVPTLTMSTTGLRYDVASFAALKVEHRTWRRGAGSPRDHGGYFQLAFTF